jgi:hypothetical protein
MPQAIASETKAQPSNTLGPDGIEYKSSRRQAAFTEGATP